MKDYKELIETLRGFGATENDWEAADAIESLVRERDEAVHGYGLASEEGYKLQAKLSAIRAAVDKHKVHGNSMRLVEEIRIILDTINGEVRPTEQPAPSDSREAFEAHIVANAGHRMAIERGLAGDYIVVSIEKQWKGWNAALAWRDSQPQAEQVPVIKPFAFATHHDEPMLFLSLKEAQSYCDDDEQPIVLVALDQSQEG